MSVNYSKPAGGPRQNNNQRENRARLTRDELVAEYNAQNSERARNARLKAQEATQSYRDNKRRRKERSSRIAAFDARQKEKEEISAKKREMEREREAAEARFEAGKRAQQTLNEATYRTPDRASERMPEVLTSKEYQEKTRKNFEHYERERAARDPYSDTKIKNSDRIVIDARGTIDSRAFNEKSIIMHTAIDERDRHNPLISTSNAEHRWNTRKNDQDKVAEAKTNPFSALFGNLGEQLSGGYSTLPQFVKIAIPIIVVLIIILIILLVRG